MRRLPILALAFAGCYAPDIEPGGACTTACPGGQVCVEGVCTAEDTDPSLVAHWRCDDPPDDGALDSSGHGHDAKCDSCPEPARGKVGGGYRFDASARQLLVVPDHPDFRGPYTIAAWVDATSTADQISALAKPVGGSSDNSWQLEVLTDARVSLSGGSPHSLKSPDGIASGAWHHLAGTWDGTTKQLFIDGARVAQVAATVDYDDHEIYLGADQNSGNEVLFWDGVLDDLRVYSRVLSDDEIADLAR
jgi:hypothetical protein